MNKSDITLDAIRKAFAYMGYAYFTNGDYNLNIFGIRNNDLQKDTFNDFVCVTYKVKDKWQLKVFEATTDPGSTYRTKLINKDGTAIMVPGQYRGAYHLGLHKGKYLALRQKKPMKYWRDANADGKLDLEGKIYEEIAYTNIHRATNIKGGVSRLVQGHSAGCQVIAAYNDFEELMRLARIAKDMYGDSFTYTLFTEDNFKCINKDLKTGA